ncbi:MAG TPA: hypothetical protein VG435_08430 [Acidimicrobiales bacterium]|jgi:hypothetical protein|nr:hypothetical protein [Acidimicrobiales bacterium]
MKTGSTAAVIALALGVLAGVPALGAPPAGAAPAASAAQPVPATAASAPAAATGAGPVLPGTTCPSFPPDAVWNTPITNLPVDLHSATWLAAMDASSTNLHPDYGPSGTSTPYGIPWTVVTSSTPRTHITFDYAGESDAGPYPLTSSTPIEGGAAASGDRHAIMVDSSTCTLYELYDAHYSASGSTAGSGAIWSLTSDTLRPAGWTSADAAGLPILPLTVNYDQVASGAMDHAIRVTAACTSESYVWPARHEAGSSDVGCPPMGARFRLAANFSLPASACSAFCQTVVATMKTYGLIVADNGSNWYFQGTADNRWTYDQVDQLKQIPARAFQAVDTSCLEETSSSAAAAISRCGAVIGNDCDFTSPTVGISPAAGGGYFRVDAGGQVCATGPAASHGDLAAYRLGAPVVGITATADGRGYWLLGADGGVFSFGDARFYGSTGGLRLNAPVVGMAVTPDSRGYWMVARDGGVFTFGDARFFGSTGNLRLLAPVDGIAVAPKGQGYWLVAADGGVFTFTGDGFYGSLGGVRLAKPIVGMASTPDGRGYTLVGSDGGVFSFGDARFYGSLGSDPPSSPVVDLAPVAGDDGYYLVDSAGQVWGFGPGA